MIKLLSFLLLFTISLAAGILQNAINKAQPYSTIVLPDGLYIGSITIDKPLTIIAKKKNAIIDANNTSTAVVIKSSNVILNGLTIQNSGSQIHKIDAAIHIEKAKNITITNCKILDSLYGIDMVMVENSNITNNYITSKKFDIELRGHALKMWYSHNNTISKNKIESSKDITLTHSNFNRITNNNLSKNRFAINIELSHANIIRNNKFSYNSVSIILRGAKDTNITNNSIKSSNGAAGMGIALMHSSNILIKNNDIKFNAKGIYIDSKPKEKGMSRYILQNNISYNKEALHFHMVIKNNTLKNNIFIGNIDDIVKSTHGHNTSKNIVEYNFWDRYSGFDNDSDNVGDTTHKIYQYTDRLWNYNHKIKFFHSSPAMSLLEFIFELAPFVEPILLLEDKKPLINI